MYVCTCVAVQLVLYHPLPTSQLKGLEQAHKEQVSAVEEVRRSLQEVKDRKEQIEQDNDKTREEIAAWYVYQCYVQGILGF